MYERTCRIERAEGQQPGVIAGILTTDGEASDGHILNIAGAELPERAPLLFGHNDWSGKGNLGSWSDFERFKKGKALGDQGIRGTAGIELDGEGEQAEWRRDIFHMIEKGHIGAFSVRWDETAPPVARVNLPSDHPAFVDAKTASGRKRWGYYFEKWRLLEGSVVTLGADPAALVGRMAASHGDLRQFWRSVVNKTLQEAEEVAPGLVGVDVGGEVVFVERSAYSAMLELANERMNTAMDILEQALNARADADEVLHEAQEMTLALVNQDHAEMPARESVVAAPEPNQGAPLPPVVTPGQVIRELRAGLEQAARDTVADAVSAIRQARGRV